MSEKVKLPREVANAIASSELEDVIRSIHCPNRDEANWPEEAVIFRYANISTEQTMNILKALVNGYEVEQTPEDKVRDYYNHITPDGWEFKGDANDPVYIERRAIRTTCILLNIKINGVNAE